LHTFCMKHLTLDRSVLSQEKDLLAKIDELSKDASNAGEVKRRKRELKKLHLNSAALLRRIHAKECLNKRERVAKVFVENDIITGSASDRGFQALEENLHGDEGGASGISNQSSIMQLFSRSFLKSNFYDSQAQPASCVVDRKCKECGGMTREICVSDSCIVCTSCGIRESWVDVGSNTIPFGTDNSEAQPGSYRRSGHLREIWSSIFGLGRKTVSDEVIEKVKKYFERRKVDCCKLKIESIRDALKELHLQAHYEDSAVILFKVNGKTMPKNDPVVFSLLDLLFARAEASFMALKARGVVTRDNFSYGPSFRQLCMLLELDDYVALCAPLKTQAKAERANEMIKEIFAANMWEHTDV
jgi:hypothetical protein